MVYEYDESYGKSEDTDVFNSYFIFINNYCYVYGDTIIFIINTKAIKSDIKYKIIT